MPLELLEVEVLYPATCAVDVNQVQECVLCLAWGQKICICPGVYVKQDDACTATACGQDTQSGSSRVDMYTGPRYKAAR